MHANNIVFDFDTITSIEDFYAIFKVKLALPNYFGNNLDALYDSLTGYIALPVKIQFIHLSVQQITAFRDIISTFEDAHHMLGDEFIFEF